jgi:tetratricopeptide (TPR) repeat protein
MKRVWLGTAFAVLTCGMAGCATSSHLLTLRARAAQAYTQGNLPAAETLYTRLTRAAPADPLLWARLGNVEALSGHPHQAVNAYNWALQLKPDFAEIRYNLAMLRMKQAQAQLIAAADTPHLPPPLAARIHALSAGISHLGFGAVSAPTHSEGGD